MTTTTTTRPPSPPTPPTETPGPVQVVATSPTNNTSSISPSSPTAATAVDLATASTTPTNNHSNSNSSNHANHNHASTTTTTAQAGSSPPPTQAAAAPFPFIPRSYQQASNTATTLGQRFKAAVLPLPFPRLYSGPLFAAPSVSVNHTHIVSSVGPLTPPLTIDHSTSSPIPSCSTSSDKSPPPSSSSTAATTATTTTTTTTVIAKQQKYNAFDVVHDIYRCMFQITLDNKGTIAALCYLPTRFQRMVEFYHTEIPTAYRDLGLGDLLVVQGFRWAETAKLLVIPTCPFVRRYLAKNDACWDCVVQSENEGLTRLLTPPSCSSSSNEENGVMTVE